ncbi:MAG: alpha/beta hydrolase, partial [Paracoccaceae bacterium]
MESLDDAYANAAHIPNADRFVPHWEETAKAFRETQLQAGRAYLDMAYGPTERQRFDHFLPSGPSEDILIFVHGGYWLRFDKSYWSHLAEGALDLG